MAAATSTAGPTGRAHLRALAAGLLALTLAGCGSGGGGGDVGPLGMGNSDQGLFGSQMQTTTVATGPSGNSPSAGTFDPTDYSCPSIEVRSGASVWQVTDKTDGGLRYQATLGQTARECIFARPDTTVKIGIQGRVLVGAKGGSGSLDVPLRVAIVQEGPSPQNIWTKLYSVPVSIGANEMQVDFSLVIDDAVFPLPSPKTLERYVIYIGFDAQAGTVSAAKPAKPKPSASPKPAAPKPVATQPAAPKPATAQQKPKPQPTQAASPAQAPVQAPAPAQPQEAAPSPAAPIPAPAEGWIGAPAPAAGTFSQ